MWFQGSIVNAIEKSKAENKLFMVFIQGKDENSQKMIQVLTNFGEATLNYIKNEVVCVQLEEGTTNCTFFGQMYPVIIVPSTYFIGQKGVLLEVIAGPVSEETFKKKLEKAINLKNAENLKLTSSQVEKENYNKVTSLNTSLISNENEQQASSSFLAKSNLKDLVSSNVNETQVSPSETQVNQPNQDFNKKLEKAKTLIEEIRIKKVKEEEEKSKKQEEERIRMGKELTQAKIRKQELELQELVKERQRDKQETKLARERVLAQIAADKEERRKRNEMNNFNNQTCELKFRNTTNQNTLPSTSTSNQSKIQFRFPDGSVKTHVFSADDHLRVVHQFVSDNSSYRNFDLSTTFPKKIFNHTQMSKSLKELGLIPNFVLLVILSQTPAYNSSSISPINFLRDAWFYIFSPFASFCSMVSNILTSFFSYSNTNSASTSATNSTTPNQNDKIDLASLRQERLNKNTKKNNYLNKKGNIARLQDNRDSDDDDGNTWNGNSTQQM